MEQREQQLYTLLDEIGIAYRKTEHPAFATCDASGDFYQKHHMGVDCRNCFMQNRRGKKHYLVVMEKHKHIDIPQLAAFLGENKKMGFASPERLQKYLGLTPGSVTPFGLLFDVDRAVDVVLDKDLLKHQYIHFHPLRNTASLTITVEDFQKFLRHCGHTVHVCAM